MLLAILKACVFSFCADVAICPSTDLVVAAKSGEEPEDGVTWRPALPATATEAGISGIKGRESDKDNPDFSANTGKPFSV